MARGAGGPHGGTYTTETARFSPWISYKTAPNNFRCDIFAGGARGCGAGAGANGRPAGSTKSSFSISLIRTRPHRNPVQLPCKSLLKNRGLVQGEHAAAGRVRELQGGTKSSFSIPLICTGYHRNPVRLPCKSRLQKCGLVQGGHAATGRVRELLGGTNFFFSPLDLHWTSPESGATALQITAQKLQFGSGGSRGGGAGAGPAGPPNPLFQSP